MFLFTDPAVGHQFGYYDGWVADVFHYTGMGQKGDQKFISGNTTLLAHASESRAVRLFKGAKGNVRYLGEFSLPWYFTDAPEKEADALRQVLVFRLLPVGTVVHDPVDELVLGSEVSTADLEKSVSGGMLDTPIVVEVPVEAQHTERALVNPSKEQYETERREQKLVLKYEAHLKLQGSHVVRFRVQPAGEAKPLYADVFDKTRNNIVEAKGSGTRSAVRMAIGQLADYSRFIDTDAARGVLLPERPRPDLEALLGSVGVFAVWPDGATFADNAGGRFV